MKVGFSGTRQGMGALQKNALRELLYNRGKPDEFHHGSCLGADAEAAELVHKIYGAEVHVVAHPSDLKGMTSEHALAVSDEIHERLPPLERNRRIVDAVDFLIACPETEQEQRRSGTWATIRYARRKEVGVIIITPGGYYIGEEG